jgi:surface polysaccharide O-acyltransferase-like enzyme
MKRNIGIDALKIVSMFMVVVLHVLGQGGLLEALPQFSIRYSISWFIEIMGLCSVNCFAMVTGYLNADKKYNFKGLISLWLQVIFYSIIMVLVVKLVYPERINSYYITKMFLPTFSHSYWYFTAYFGVYLFMPLLNVVIQKTERKTITNILVLIILCVGIGGLFNSNLMWEASGYSTIWLMIMYLLGGVYKKYKTKKEKNGLTYIFYFLLFCAIDFCIKMVVDKYFVNVDYINRLSYSTLNYSSIFLVLASIQLFRFFEQYEPNNKYVEKIVNFLVPTSFGVYLVHVNPAVWENFMKGRFLYCTNYLSVMYIVVFFASCIGLYLLCSFIDYGRLKLFEKIKVKNFVIKVDNYLQNKFLN